jgi:hypothetical protein
MLENDENDKIVREEQVFLKILDIEDELERKDLILARASISLFTRKEVSTEDLDNLISDLKRKNWINEAGNKIFLDNVGESLLDNYEMDLMPEEAFISIKERYETGDEDYCNQILNQISSDIQYAGERINVFDKGENLKTNAVLTDVEASLNNVVVSSRDYVSKDKHWQKRNAKDDLLDKLVDEIDSYVFAKARDDSISIITDSTVELDKLKGLASAEYRIETAESADFADLDKEMKDFFVNENINSFLMNKKGLVKLNKNNHKFVEYSDYQTKDTEIGSVKLFEGFNFDVDFKGENKGLIWVEPSSTIVYSVNDAIDYLKVKEGFKGDNDDIKEKLVGLDVKALPKRSSATIKDIIFDPNEFYEQSDRYDSFEDLAQEWKEKYNIEIEKGLPIVEIDFGNFALHYPSDTVQLDKYEREKEFGSLDNLSPALYPDQRADRIDSIYRNYLQDASLRYGDLNIRNDLVSLAKLEKEDIIHSYGKIKPPKVVFSDKNYEDSHTDPRKIFEYGGFAGKKKVTISKIFVPMDVNEATVRNFLETVDNSYEDTGNFGEFEYGNLDDIIRRYPTELKNGDPSKIESIIRREKSSIDGHAIIVMPDNNSAFRSKAKQAAIEHLQEPDQVIQLDTFRDVAFDNYPVAKNLALQFYIKELDGGKEVPWILSQPSDGREDTKTAYVGFSFSRKEEKSANSFIAVCDSKGRRVHQKLDGIAFKDDRFIDKNWASRFFESVEKTLKETVPDYENEIDRLVIYKRGWTQDWETENIRMHLEEQEGIWSEIDIDLISVREQSIKKRLMKKEGKMSNVDGGTFVSLNDEEGMFVATKPPNGTAKPLNIKLENGSKLDMNEIMKEYRDRIALNWMSPVQQGKWGLELKISKNMADLAREFDFDKNLDINYIFV